MKNAEQKRFARRFTFDDWSWLCSRLEFLDALEAKSADECEVIAMRLLTERP